MRPGETSVKADYMIVESSDVNRQPTLDTPNSMCWNRDSKNVVGCYGSTYALEFELAD